MGEVIRLDARRRAPGPTDLDAVADELGLSAPMLWAWLGVEGAMRERQGLPPRDPREDGERVLIALCGEEAVQAAMDRIEARDRRPHRLMR